jgi:CxxC-x17-CxxC domain-containing protein
MKKNSKSKSKTAATPPVDPYLEGLMAKLLERLVGLERKIDTVIAQTGTKTSGNSEAPKSFQQNNQTNEPRRKDRVLYEAICADCHNVCEVPFKPSEGRAVYCKECFAKRKSGAAGNNHNVPRPAAVFQKQAERPSVAPVAVLPARETSGKSKKNTTAKKAKKKK